MNTTETTQTPVLEFATRDSYKLRGGQRAEITVGDITVKFILTNKNDSYRYVYPKTRIFVDGEQDVDFATAYELANAAGSFSRGVSEESDKMFDKLNRQVVKNQRTLIEEAMELVPELAAVLDGVKMFHSRRAGCSCPCSPGFVAQARIHVGAEVDRQRYTEDGVETYTEVAQFQVGDIFVWKTKPAAAEVAA